MSDEGINEERPYNYAVKSAGLNMWLDNEHVHAKNGVLSLTETQHKEMQKLLRTGKRQDLMQEVSYIDQDAAEKQAFEYLARNPRPQAHQGSVHSQANAEKGGDLKVVNPPEPKGGSLLGKLKGSADSVLATQNPQNPANKPFVVTESDIIRAEDIAPPVPDVKPQT